MRFDIWIRENGLTLEQVAERIGSDPANVRRYRAAEQIPRAAQMARIYLASNGQVTPNDFYRLPTVACAPDDLAENATCAAQHAETQDRSIVNEFEDAA